MGLKKEQVGILKNTNILLCVQKSGTRFVQKNDFLNIFYWTKLLRLLETTGSFWSETNPSMCFIIVRGGCPSQVSGREVLNV